MEARVWRVIMTNWTFNVGNLFDERLPFYCSFRLDDKISFCRNEEVVKGKKSIALFWNLFKHFQDQLRKIWLVFVQIEYCSFKTSFIYCSGRSGENSKTNSLVCTKIGPHTPFQLAKSEQKARFLLNFCWFHCKLKKKLMICQESLPRESICLRLQRRSRSAIWS